MELSRMEKGFEKLLIPAKKITFEKGFFRWPASPVLASPSYADLLPLEQLSKDLSSFKSRAKITRNAYGPADLRIHRDKKIVNQDSYRLIVTAKEIEIYARCDSGAYYAMQTLREMVTIFANNLPLCRIEDRPDFLRRGVYHDCSRGKVPTLQTLKKLVERLAHWKINEFQLYIENVFTFKQHPDIGKGFCPFTPQEILDLQDHCKRHHVKLVGSLASFGHLEKILMLPKYQALGEMPGFRNLPGGTTLCPTDPGSIKLIRQLYDEFVPLFEAKDFNVCCDETWELGKGRSKKLADRIGTGQIYLDFLLKIYELCQKHGKRMNLWADIVLKHPELLKKLPKDLVLLNWEYEQAGANIARTKDIAKAGMAFMVCPGTSSWLTHGTRLPNSMANVTNFAAQGRKYQAEGLLNTDWGDNGHRNFMGVSLHSFAHGAAQAWNGKAVDNEKFTENFCFHVFGQKNNRLAKTVRMLGNNYLTCKTNVPNKSWLYFALVEPMVNKDAQTPSAIELMDSKGLQKILEQFSSPAIWPALPSSIDYFEKIAFEELNLAARMDCLASRRALATKTIRAGNTVKGIQLRQIRGQMEQMAKDFKSLWLLRNKVSRLGDNMKLFKKAGKG